MGVVECQNGHVPESEHPQISNVSGNNGGSHHLNREELKASGAMGRYVCQVDELSYC